MKEGYLTILLILLFIPCRWHQQHKPLRPRLCILIAAVTPQIGGVMDQLVGVNPGQQGGTRRTQRPQNPDGFMVRKIAFNFKIILVSFSVCLLFPSFDCEFCFTWDYVI